MRPWLALIPMLLPSFLAGALPVPEITLRSTPRPLLVDARLQDWPESRVLLLDRKEQVAEGRGFWRTPQDGSAKIYLTYDAEYLYVSAVVMQDHPPMNPGSGADIWNGDCVELMISSRAEPGPFFSRGDVHLGFSPGDGTRDPVLWCFHLDRLPAGARIASRKTPVGYLLEAAVPWDLLGGLEVAPGRIVRMNAALGVGGSLSGERVVTLDLSGEPGSWRNPSAWSALRFTGAPVVTVPWETEADPRIRRVKEGTLDSTLLDVRDVRGRVLDGRGSTAPDARVRTWPRTSECVTDREGSFLLGRTKVYDTSALTVVKDGFFPAFVPLEKGVSAVTVRLENWDAGFPDGGILTAANGNDGTSSSRTPRPVLVDRPRSAEDWDALTARAALRPRKPTVIRLDASADGPREAAQCVRECNRVRRLGMQDWMVSFAGSPDPVEDPYRLVNRFREIASAIRAADPDTRVWGPDLPLPGGEEGWLGPFLRHDGDVLSCLAVRAEDDGTRLLSDVLWEIRAVLRRSQYVAGTLLGSRLPLAVLGGSSEGRQALWDLSLAGSVRQEGGLYVFSPVTPGSPDPVPASALSGTPLGAGSRIPSLEVFASKCGEGTNVVLAELEGIRGVLVNLSLGDKTGDAWVDLGLARRLSVEVPASGIRVLRLGPDGKLLKE